MKVIRIFLFTLGTLFLFSPIVALPIDDIIDQIDDINYEIEGIAADENDLYNLGMEYINANPSMNPECLEKLDRNFSGLLFQYKPDAVDWEDFDPIKSRKIDLTNEVALQNLLDTMTQQWDSVKTEKIYI